MAELLDPDWYVARYPDVAASDLTPQQHFIRHGAAERRDPNRYFDNAWYIEHYPDVAASGFNPLMHYVQAGAAELRNPHPRFDAVYYVGQHPDAAANPLLYHLRIGQDRGYLTEEPVGVRDYLPSERPPLPLPQGVFADIVILLHRDHGKAWGDAREDTRRCIRSVLADRAFPLARIIVVDDAASGPELSIWLQGLAADGEIHLIRNRRQRGVATSANLGMEAAEGHDVVLLNGANEIPAGWLRRLAAHAYSQPDIGMVSPLSDYSLISGNPADEDASVTPTNTPAHVDEICRIINAGRSAEGPVELDHCTYIRRAVLRAVGAFSVERRNAADEAQRDFCKRVASAGWQHRVAYDLFVRSDKNLPIDPQLAKDAAQADIIPFRFAATAALFRASKLPVILMITHSGGGGVRRHIENLVERYRGAACVLLLQGADRGAELSIAALPHQPLLTLPADRLDDLVTVLRSTNLTRVHIHHLLRMEMDVRALIQRLGVPFDVTVHDYYAICPQINLLRWDEGIYCGEPGPATCNACIAGQSSHGARDIVAWRRGWAWQFLDAERVICPSADVKARLDRYGLGKRAIVVPHEPQMETVWNTRLPEFAAPPLRVVLLGVLANHKGARAVAEVAEAADPGAIELHLAGELETSFPQQVVRLIKATGRYQDRDLPAVLRRIDPHVFWFPSSAPETYSYTLSTAIETGLPIVAADFGSFTERLSGRPNTWLVDHRASPGDWLAAFEDVRATLRNRVDQPPVPRPLAPLDFYTNRYLSPAPKEASGEAFRKTSPDPFGKPRIAIVPERYSNSGLTPWAYIRLLQPLDHPTISDTFDLVLADVETIFSCHADIIITHRCAILDLNTADRLADHARRTGAKLVFDLDDDLLRVPDTHPDVQTLLPLAKVVRRMLTVADVVWVSTPGLAESLATIRPDAFVIANRLDERIWMHGPVATPFWHDPIRILCMGTTTHDADFALIEPVLLRLKAEYGDRIVIDVLGMTRRSELPAEFGRIIPSTHASRSYPGFVDWLTTTQPRWHIGLAPLLDTPFNRSKSPIKAMDYAALGMAVLASDTPVYRGSIADGPAGQLVTNEPRFWHAALDWLIRNQALREATAMQARRAFVAQATLASYAAPRLAALTQLVPGRTKSRSAGLRDAPSALTIAHGSTDPATRKRRHSGRG